MWSVSPRFSWITSTAPLGCDAAAHAPCSSPLGPANRMLSLAPGGVAGAAVDDADDVAGPSRAVGSFGFVGVLADWSGPPPHAVRSAPAAVMPSPRRPSRRRAS